jgi:hypothetical protein
VIDDADLLEVSVVDNPASKTCRVLSVQFKCIRRDYMSWSPIDADLSLENLARQKINILSEIGTFDG